MTTIHEARVAMQEFLRLWAETPGVSREDAVAAAFHADEVIERLDDYDAHYGEADGWIGELGCVPDVEKRWLGLREYREFHRVKAKQ